MLSFAGLIISTIAVHVASDATVNSSRLLHTVAVEMANVAAYGALWILQFVLCDRILFSAPVDDSRAHDDPGHAFALGGGVGRGDEPPAPPPARGGDTFSRDDVTRFVSSLTARESPPAWETLGSNDGPHGAS
jgi:hypothetical protein